MDLTVPDTDAEVNRPTPSAVLAMAVKAMFENGQLARAGQLALEGAAKGVAPSEYLRERFKEREE